MRGFLFRVPFTDKLDHDFNVVSGEMEWYRSSVYVRLFSKHRLIWAERG